MHLKHVFTHILSSVSQFDFSNNTTDKTDDNRGKEIENNVYNSNLATFVNTTAIMTSEIVLLAYKVYRNHSSCQSIWDEWHGVG